MTQSEVTVQVTPLPVKPGEMVGGKYRVEHLLGAGGMGAVVCARHMQLDQLVAIKFLYTHARNHPEAIARFDREAKVVVKLRSEHVARVMDVGRTEDDSPYIVMEYLQGCDLADLLEQRGALEISDAVDFVLQACEAIAEAHALGVVHRDLKPKNLFLTTTARGNPLVKVLDFGISKMMDGENDLSLTKTQSIIGSPNYMSPEQLRSSRDVDARTDIWSLGAILYELLTGAVPFPAETVTQLTAMVIADPPTPIESYRGDVPEALRAVIMRCLEKSRDARFANVTELATALLPFAKASTHFAVPAHSSDALAAEALSISQKVDRPSIRVPGGETSSAWGDTQLAGGAPRKRWPLVVSLAAVALVGGGVLAAVIARPAKDPEPLARPTGAALTAPPPSTNAPGPALVASDVPTTRDLPAPNPLLSPTGGPPRPLPSNLTAAKRDASAATSVTSVVTTPPPPPPSSTASEDLPSVRH